MSYSQNEMVGFKASNTIVATKTVSHSTLSIHQQHNQAVQRDKTEIERQIQKKRQI